MSDIEGPMRLGAADMAIDWDDRTDVLISTANKYSFTQLFTLGGLRVDEESGHVIRPDGTRIEGLYAAGRAAVGLCSIGYVSGMSIADAVFSGRRAARNVADQVQPLEVE